MAKTNQQTEAAAKKAAEAEAAKKAAEEDAANAAEAEAAKKAKNAATGYIAAIAVKHNGKRYKPGEVIDGLDDDAAIPLLAVDAVAAIVTGEVE
jgi:hypothetical protein